MDPSRSPLPGTRARRTAVIAVGVLAAAVAASTGIVAFRPESRPAAVAEVSRPARALTPVEQVAKVLDDQAAALLAGDEKGWLAPVDRKLTARYRSIYRNLRGLDVTHAEFHTYDRAGRDPGADLSLSVSLAYCLSTEDCPAWRRDPEEGPPRIQQTITFRPVRGRYTIVKVADGTGDRAPWQHGDLVFARGERVTVAAPKSQAKSLRRVLAAAEKAAVTADRFAQYMANPQRRYRIYLADTKGWRSWYGGMDSDWAVGYAIPLNTTGTDVILRLSKITSTEELATTIKHELGHAVTLGGAEIRGFDSDRWVSEGIAEYIGWSPRPARKSWNRYSVRAAFRGATPPKTVVTAPLGARSTARSVETFYALAHFAVDCLADRYGERKLFDFVRLTLREDRTHDEAARTAFGKPFATVDKACVRWIRDEAG